MMHKSRVILNKIGYFFRVLYWAMRHTKEVKDYKFLLSLRKVAHDKFLKEEREGHAENAVKAETQVKLLDKIINYTDGK